MDMTYMFLVTKMDHLNKYQNSDCDFKIFRLNYDLGYIY